MLLSRKPALCRRSLKWLSKKKKEPAEEEYRFLLLWEMTVDQIGTENFFQSLKQTGSFDVILAFESWTCGSGASGKAENRNQE